MSKNNVFSHSLQENKKLSEVNGNFVVQNFSIHKVQGVYAGK